MPPLSTPPQWTPQRPGDPPYTRRTPRVIAASKLCRRRARDESRQFLAEGPQAVREALDRLGLVRELFVTAVAEQRYPDLIERARQGGVPVSVVTADAAGALSETVTPPGLVAVCHHLDVPLASALEPELAGQTRLVAVLVDIRDPGNAGTVLRTADAAGADVVIFAGEAVDPYNGKCVRASAGSLFHVDVVRSRALDAVMVALRTAGLRVLAATAHGGTDLDDLPRAALARPTAWLFGSEAHGLPAELADAADAQVRVPVYGRAESLNLAAAAAVCLYTSARAQRREESTDDREDV